MCYVHIQDTNDQGTYKKNQRIMMQQPYIGIENVGHKLTEQKMLNIEIALNYIIVSTWQEASRIFNNTKQNISETTKDW